MATQHLMGGNTVMIHGGRGMGKSVLIQQIFETLSAQPSVKVLKIGAPEPGADRLSHWLRSALSCPAAGPLSIAIEQWLRTTHQGVLVILIDELDAWVDPSVRDDTRLTLNALSTVSQSLCRGRLGALTAGGISNLLLSRIPWGSHFASRARKIILKPFTQEQVKCLAAPLQASEEWLEELQLASGGIPLLVCHALEHAADDDPLSPHSRLQRFLTEYPFAEQVLSSIQAPDHADALRLLQQITTSQGAVAVDDLNAVLSPGHRLKTVLDLLIGAGLVHSDADCSVDPCQIRLNPSVLAFQVAPPRPTRRPDPWEGLRAAVREACSFLRVHRMDLFQGSGTERKLVTEATLSALLAIYLAGRGYTARREQQQAQGRTDVRVSGGGLNGHAVIEMKIWGRKHGKAEEQATGYAVVDLAQADRTIGLFVIMVHDRALPSETYEAQMGLPSDSRAANEPLWSRRVPVGPVTIPIVHHLVCLPRGAG